ncbi:MAG: CpsD/CapB family tyrosine-protein kinase, partial [Desulfobacterales bacterium]|nr:CpsD/CapB family tyrosine-protein kinase [Desulfobacterales bacterium]
RKFEKPLPVQNFTSEKIVLRNPTIEKACRYSSINRMMEKIVIALKNLSQNKEKKNRVNGVLISSPHDCCGNTFLVSVLGYNAALHGKMSVLLLDLNMRKPELHLAFDIEQKTGFTDIVREKIDWKKVIKHVGMGLSIITAGQPDNQLYNYLNPSILKDIFYDMKNEFDLIIFDSSPILSQNRNNVDVLFLSSISDLVILLIQEKKTTKSDLKNAVDIITKGGGKVNGIIYNKQFRQDIVSKKFLKFMKVLNH